MMIATVELLLVGFLLTGVMIKPYKCQSNETNCSMYLDEVREVLASKIPPIKDSRMTDNYYNISMALFPSIDLPALYVKVTIQFLKDYRNGSKVIDDTKTMKLTWSKACTYVSVKHINLFAMTVFSLATVFPQRRETELTFTVLPFCKDSPYAQDKETTTKMWRYIVSTLEDIIVNPKVSDPRINTVACVVEGHEGDKEQPIKYPKNSGPKVVIWDFCWLVFAASLTTSLVIWVYLRKWLKHAMKKGTEDKTLRILAGTVLKMTIITFVITFLIFSLSFIIRCSYYEGLYVITYSVLVGVSAISLILWSIRLLVKLNRKNQISGCCTTASCEYKLGFWLLLPGLFMSIHHFLWVICGIISEPYWATPIFLIECLFGFSIMYCLYLYEKDVVVHKRVTVDKCGIVFHLICAVVAFTLILLVVVFVGHGHIVNVTTAGVIEVVITITFMWLVKNSGLHLKSFGKKKPEVGDGEAMQQLTTQQTSSS